MGYALAMGPCVRCHLPFGFNPNKVPSIKVNGVREPVCRECFEYLNTVRVKQGLEPTPLLPGAYDAADENEINWDD